MLHLHSIALVSFADLMFGDFFDRNEKPLEAWVLSLHRLLSLRGNLMRRCHKTWLRKLTKRSTRKSKTPYVLLQQGIFDRDERPVLSRRYVQATDPVRTQLTFEEALEVPAPRREPEGRAGESPGAQSAVLQILAKKV